MTTPLSLAAFIYLCLLSFRICTEEPRTFEGILSEASFKAEKPLSFFTLSVENDMLGSGSDEHYSSGVRAT